MPGGVGVVGMVVLAGEEVVGGGGGLLLFWAFFFLAFLLLPMDVFFAVMCETLQASLRYSVLLKGPESINRPA
jgi:hypothetical protein